MIYQCLKYITKCRGVLSLVDLGSWKELLKARVSVKLKKPSVFDDFSELFKES